MSGSIDVDIGGTFTDCFAQLGSRVAWCKTRTTGYDLGRGLLQAVDEAAAPAGRGHRGPARSGRHRQVLDHPGSQHAAPAQRAQARLHHHRGIRGPPADRPGQPVVGRPEHQGAAQRRPGQEAEPADRAGGHGRSQEAHGPPRQRRAPPRRGGLPVQARLPRGPGGPRLRRVPALVARQPGPRAADPGADRAGIRRALPRPHAGVPVQRELPAAAGVHPRHHHRAQRLPAHLDVRRAVRDRPAAARGRLPGAADHGPQHRRDGFGAPILGHPDVLRRAGGRAHGRRSPRPRLRVRERGRHRHGRDQL